MEAIEHHIINNDWISILLAGILLLLVVVKLNYSNRLKQLVFLPVDKAYILNFQEPVLHLFNLLFLLISHVIFSLLVFQSISFFNPELSATTDYLFLKIIILVFGFSTVKYTVDWLLSLVFDLKTLFLRSLFIKWSFFFNASIVLFIILVFAIYNSRLEGTFLYVSWLFFTLLMLLRYYHFIRANKTVVFSKIFYFILYLCALEIAPLLVVLKFVIS